MIRKVFCFRGIVYSESDCPSPDPDPFVPVPGRGRELRTMRWIPSLCIQQSPCCIRSTIPSHAALLRTIISVFLQEAPDFQEGPSARLCPYHHFALSLRPKSTPAAKSGRSIRRFSRENTGKNARFPRRKYVVVIEIRIRKKYRLSPGAAASDCLPGLTTDRIPGISSYIKEKALNISAFKCPGQDSNLHERNCSLPPQSSVSTNFTTWADLPFPGFGVQI